MYENDVEVVALELTVMLATVAASVVEARCVKPIHAVKTMKYILNSTVRMSELLSEWGPRPIELWARTENR